MSFLPEPITIQSLFGQGRSFGAVPPFNPITVQVVVNENTSDVLTITKQPVQQGANITDHAYKEPTTFSMQIFFADNLGVSLSKVYQNLLDLQSYRAPFDVITPKRIYHNMLISSLGLTTDKATENTLAISLSFQEVIIVQVVTTQVPRARQKSPGKTGATQNAGQKQSFLYTGKSAVGGLIGK